MPFDEDDDKTVFKPKNDASSSDSPAETESEPNTEDKTVFKPRAGPTPVQSDSDADKTRIAMPAKAPVEADLDEQLFSSETFAALSPEEQKRVAKLAAKRKKARQQEEQNDRTRLQPRVPESLLSGAPLNSIDTDEGETDKTIIKPADLGDFESAKTVITSTPPSEYTPKDKPAKQPVLLKNRFELEAVLGAGGMGVVYKAKDRLKIEAQDRDPFVAIKVLGEEFKSHPEAFIALQRESRKTQRIAHPNIVNVHDFDRDGDTVFMTMEFLEGEPLDKLIKKYRTTGLPEDMAWKILEGISSALIHAHQENIIHSDFKPGNIFVTEKNAAKVFDFGIARAVAKAENLEESIDDKTVFDAGNLGALTPAYASKEMLDGETPDVRDDIYALGCIAYELFTGRHPYNRLHANEAANQKIKPKRIAGITKKQSRVIERAVAFNREDRIVTVQEFWNLLNAKRAPIFVMSSVALLFIAVVAFAGVQFYQGQNLPTFSEDEARSEIEMQLRFEGHKEELEKLLTNPTYTPNWEENIWEHFRGIKTYTASDDIYMLSKRIQLYELYKAGITNKIAEKNFNSAKTLLSNMERYTNETAELVRLAKQLEDAIGKDLAEKEIAKKQQDKKDKAAKLVKQDKLKKQKEAKVDTEKNIAFDVAMDTVNKQLTCRALAMRDFSIAIEKLRSLNPARYTKQEDKIINTLAACITTIGKTFSEKAQNSKTLAMRTFPKSSVIKNIKIIPRDPCDLRLSGLGARGARAVCRDKIEGVGKSPAMVVIPGKGSIAPFAMAKYEVSIGDYLSFCKPQNECGTLTSKDTSLPVTNISAVQMQQYVSWLSKKTKQTYKLPTKAQWVYAAKATNGQMDSNRNCELNSYGIQKGKVLVKATTGKSNKWGLISMVGNARELIKQGSNTFIALGGSYQTPMAECTITTADPHNGKADAYTGFRFIREIAKAQ